MSAEDGASDALAWAVQRDRRVVRRGLTLGLVLWLLCAVVLVAAALWADAGGRAVLVGVTLAWTVGVIGAAAWLLVAGVVDLVADLSVSRRRLWWTVGVTLLAFVSPVLVLGAAGTVGA